MPSFRIIIIIIIILNWSCFYRRVADFVMGYKHDLRTFVIYNLTTCSHFYLPFDLQGSQSLYPGISGGTKKHLDPGISGSRDIPVEPLHQNN